MRPILSNCRTRENATEGAKGGCSARNPCDDRSGFVNSPQRQKGVSDMVEASQKFTAGPLTFTVRHELWDGNIHDHECCRPTAHV